MTPTNPFLPHTGSHRVCPRVQWQPACHTALQQGVDAIFSGGQSTQRRNWSGGTDPRGLISKIITPAQENRNKKTSSTVKNAFTLRITITDVQMCSTRVAAPVALGSGAGFRVRLTTWQSSQS